MEERYIQEADFETLYQLNYRGVVSLAFALTGNSGAAEEMAQDAFLVAYQRWERVGSYDDPVAFVRRVVATRAVNRWRKLGREARALTRLQSRRSVVISVPDSTSDFIAAIRRLPPRQAKAVALFYFADLSVGQIALILDLSDGTVKTHLHRARTNLARALNLADGDDT